MRLTMPATPLDTGDTLALTHSVPDSLNLPLALAPRPWTPPPVGALLVDLNEPRLRITANLRWPDGPEAGGATMVSLAEVLAPAKGSGKLDLEVSREGLSLAWITLSDTGYRGEREDASGPLVEETARKKISLSLVRGFVLPDESAPLKALLTDLCLTQGFDLVFTTGGTGLTSRDITPEATLAVIEKRLPGFERAMTAASLAKTPHGAISRAVAGTLGTSIIVNLPGSPKAVAENLEAILPALRHASEKLQDDPTPCAR